MATVLLRLVRRRDADWRRCALLGVDDFASNRGQCYGAVLCDLERRHIIHLLPDREAE